MADFEQTSKMPVSSRELFAWHSRPGAFQRLSPPWEAIRVLRQQGGIRDGALLEMEIRKGPVAVRWLAHHSGYCEGSQFRDEQVRGPFSRWVHTHRFEPDGEDASQLWDRVEYELPLGPVGALFGARTTQRMMERMFAHRHNRTHNDLSRHKPYADRPPLRVAVTGASGLIGTQLVAFLRSGGHRVDAMVRRTPAADSRDIFWNPVSGEFDRAGLEGVDAVVHLAGENIAGGRWTRERKERIRASRVEGTSNLVSALIELEHKPKTLIVASAIGYYGARGDEPLREDSPPGQGFLSEVCEAWEQASRPALDAGIRVVNLRLGVVLSAAGGALAKMLTPFRLGAGGRVGSGKQSMSWIALDDVVGMIHHVLMNDELSGPVNATAPEPVTNEEFTRTLGRVLHRPTLFPVPKAAIRAAFGEMGEALLLEGSRVLPARAQAAGFSFLYPTLEAALHAELGR